MSPAAELWVTTADAWWHRYEALTAALSADERARRDRFLDPNVGRLFALGRGLLRAALAHCLDCSPSALAFETGVRGKPRLVPAPGREDVSFNVSASRERLAVAICESHDVGVDIEPSRHVSEGLFQSHHVLAAAERERLVEVPPDEKAQVFLRWWVRKEAVAKAEGSGLGIGLHRIAAGSPAFDPCPRVVHVADRSFFLCDAQTPRGVVCAVAVEGVGTAPVPFVRAVDFSEAIDDLLR